MVIMVINSGYLTNANAKEFIIHTYRVSAKSIHSHRAAFTKLTYFQVKTKHSLLHGFLASTCFHIYHSSITLDLIHIDFG